MTVPMDVNYDGRGISRDLLGPGRKLPSAGDWSRSLGPGQAPPGLPVSVHAASPVHQQQLETTTRRGRNQRNGFHILVSGGREGFEKTPGARERTQSGDRKSVLVCVSKLPSLVSGVIGSRASQQERGPL